MAGWLPLTAAAGLAAVGYITWYALRAAQVVFGGHWLVRIPKVLAVTVVYLACFSGVTLLLLAYAVARM